MMNESKQAKSPNDLEKKRAILEYWTLVEFFSPYHLENAIHHKQSIQKVYSKELLNEQLPWFNAPVIRDNDPTTPFAKGYHLYLGLFSTEETADRARHYFAKEESEWQSVNWRNCGATGSTTCFARLTITTHGIPLFGTLTLSTLPWAHGRLLNGNEKGLTIEKYWKSVNRLLLKLREEFSVILPTKLMKKPDKEARYLDANTLSELVDLFYEWAEYKPHDYPIAVIEPLSGDHTIEAKDLVIKSGRDVPILNSFYIQDLESAAISLMTQKGKPLDCYLSENQEHRISLDGEEGAKTILAMVQPEKIPAGRWPASPIQQQSLMQQFAINAIFDTLKNEGVFSVNGPPGTGKTSLLREIIAQNIVSRAEALSKFKQAKDVCIGRQALNFDNHDPIFIAELDPSILGYEMVVVSSNNTAIHNLSRELPLRSQLAPPFKKASYLETVATKMLGLKENEAWGLISATLGNMENCRQFVETVFMIRNEAIGESRIWEWIDNYRGASFCEARDAFVAIKNHQEHVINELEMLACLHQELYGHTIATYCKEICQRIEEAEEESERIQSRLSRILQEETEVKELLTLLQERESLWKQQRPGIFERILQSSSSSNWSEKFDAYLKERIEAIEKLQTIKTDIRELRTLQSQQKEFESQVGEELFDKALQFHLLERTYHKLKEAHPQARLPKGTNELEEMDAHTQSFYQTEELNTLRSELFIAAMTLHEAWIAEVSRLKKGFRGNLMAIGNILQGKSPSTADDTRRAWQSLFLFIPVISSTFASIGRLFRHLEPNTLGWVLIDEAGQAIPQASIGSIWRAQRVVSIGDPFQIEPISTISPEVIDGMAKKRINDHTLQWAPSQVSVQNLMDRASLFGIKRETREESHWLGSPLRVHRRCLEPMFTIANTIAYEGSMLLASESTQQTALLPSCWWDVGGQASHRQYVADQGTALIDLLMDCFIKMQSPDIYVISPFREIITQIQHLILGDKGLNELFENQFPSIPLQQWVRQGVGTVHTFQGKQAFAVFFVLGGDRTTLGALDWASRKPNLLNVAITRAQSRFYIIGDYDLWSGWPHFDFAAKKLQRRRIKQK